ncbi:MAG: type II secretion system protein [Pseudobdellovibrionaceae bacterium]|nr:type II secretion system protein [Pseudobdellovibrionaceae bacterium]
MDINKDTRQSGYTLIQMAIALIVVGLLFSVMANFYSQYKNQQGVKDSYSNIETAINSIATYYANQGRIPCPAPMTTARNATGYGTESACRSGAIAALLPGECSGGICVEETVRASLTGTDRRVIVGTIPFRELQISEDRSFDGYGSRYVYAVTMSATDETTYSNLKGAISVRDANGDSLTDTDGSILYLVLSHGKTKIGSYGKEGGLNSACPTGAGSPLDSENCNVGFDTGTSVDSQSIYISAQESLGTSSAFFDDYVSYFTNNSDPTWKRTSAEPEDIEDLSSNFVGVGTTTPSVDLAVNSSGSTDSIRVYGTTGTDGTLYTDQICDETGGNCFSPLAIAGDNSVAGEGMKCPKASDPVGAIYMVGIENGEPKCSEAIEVLCGPGLVLKSFSGTNPVCVTAPVTNCPPTTVTICNGYSNPVTVNIPGGSTNAFWPSNGSSYEGPAGDDNCRRERYRCNGTSWVLRDGLGTCKSGVLSGTPTTYAACRNFLGHSGNANYSGVQGFGWDNNVTVQTISTCLGTGVTSQYDVSACSCKDDDTRTVTNAACPAPYTGVNKRKITYTAQCEYSGNIVNAADLVPRPDLGSAVTPATPRKHFGLNTGVPDDSLCACSNVNRIEFLDCPSGFKRKSPPTPASFTLTPYSWPVAYPTRGRSYQVNVASDCTETADPINDQCECDTSISYSHSNTTCADPVCQEPKTNLITISGYPGAGNVQEGWDVFENTRDPMLGCTATSNQIQTGNCQAKGFSWIESHTNGDAYTIQPPNEVGKECTCANHVSTMSSTVPCYRPADASKTLYFCKCQ